jgi:predicted ferric reductase
MKKFVSFVIIVLIIILILALIPFTILRVTPFETVSASIGSWAYFAERLFGMAAFVLLFTQLVTRRFNKNFDLHIWFGILAYLALLLHPLFFGLHSYFGGAKPDPFYIFTAVCVLCRSKWDFFINFGRIAFWLFTASIFVGFWKTANVFMRKNWRFIHILSYPAFIVSALHGFLLGTDFKTQPFFTFAVVATAVISGLLIFEEIPRLWKVFKNWLKS